MTTSSDANPQPAPRWVIAGALTIALFGVAWLMLHTNTSYAASRCSALYGGAHTAADTAAVDSLRPTRNATPAPTDRSCGSIRGSSGWR